MTKKILAPTPGRVRIAKRKSSLRKTQSKRASDSNLHCLFVRNRNRYLINVKRAAHDHNIVRSSNPCHHGDANGTS